MTQRKFILLVFFLCVALTSCRSTSASRDNSTYYLLEDNSHQLTADEAWNLFLTGRFERQGENSFNPGFTTSIYWLVIEPDTTSSQLSLVEIGTSQINNIDFFSVRDNVPELLYKTGDSHPFTSRPRPSLNFTFPLDGSYDHYLVRIDKSNESLQLTFRIAPETVLINHTMEISTTIGIMTGMIVLMLVFGFYLTFITKEKVYLFYILYVAAGWLYVLANEGFGFKFLWPESMWFADRARPVFALITIGLSLTFIDYYAGKAAYRWLRIIMRTLAYTAYFLALLAFTPGVDLKASTPGYYFQALIPILVSLYIIALLTTLIQKIYNGNRMAIFYLSSVAPIVVFSTLQVFYYSGGLDFSGSFLQHYGQGTGYVLEAVILTFGLAYRFNNYRREKEQLLITLNNQQAKYARAIISTQETERRQLADQLHDVAGSLLSAAKLNLSSVREKNWVTDEAARTKLGHAEEAVTSIGEMLRNLSHAISPIILEKAGFRQSVEKISAIFNASGKISVELEILGFEKIQPEMFEKYSILYGILYELINNIVKHAQATHALVQLIEHDESVVMIVEDNGKGLESDDAENTLTHGLEGIKSKIHYLDGILAFDNAERHGLIVTIEIPKKNDDKNYFSR